MFQPTMRDGVWFATLVAVSLGWYFEYRQDARDRDRDARTIQFLNQKLNEQPEPRVVSIRLNGPDEPGPMPDQLRPIPGEWDYQFPPHHEFPPVKTLPLP
jgi:hypothetical protein